MTLKQRLARQRKKRDLAAKNYRSRTARLKTITARLARRPKLGVFIAEKFDLRISSTWRSVAHNAAVGGVPNSWHTKGSLVKPGATDWVGSVTNMRRAEAWIRANVPDIAETLIHDVGSGLHLHAGGWGVANFDWPKSEPRGKKLRAAIRRAKLNRAAAQKRIDWLKAAIKARRPVKAKGIDVSNHQGTVDWRAVKEAGYTFAWVKSSEGTTFVDSTFHRNVRAAKAAGLKVGAYHFLRPRRDRSGAAEADVFAKLLKAAGLGAGDLVPVMDIESADGLSPSEVAAYTRAFRKQLVAHGHKKVALYTFPFFMRSWPTWAKTSPLWIADFRGLAKPTLPAPWTSYAAWQHTDKGSVPGVKGLCDKNITPDLRKLIAS
jgi:GH25 family lysozyme M1 (1,4-beta-N-acetylmuramidase)